MSKVYDRAFKVGVGITILVFTVCNVVSFIDSRNNYLNRKIKFAHDGYSWGFPFKMYSYYLGYPYSQDGFTVDGVVSNTVVVVFCSFVLGFILKSVWAETISRRIE